MIDKPDPPTDEKPDADQVFAATLRNLVNTPHKPHKPATPQKGAKDDNTR